MIYIKKRIALFVAVVISMVALSGCGQDENGTKIVFTTGIGKDAVFRVEEEVCKKEELLVYLINTQNQYEEVYGRQIWEAVHNGVTLEQNVKETVLAKSAQIKTMYLMAKERGLRLNEQETERVASAAAAYYGSLNDREKEVMGVSLETIQKLYHEYALAEKVYHLIIQDVNPEISDDEARIIKVQHILVKTYTVKEDGKKIPYSVEEKAKAYEKAVQIQKKALENSDSFEEIASQYNEDDAMTYSFGKGQMDQAFETAAFHLERNEISDVVESEAGYHIIKCINTFDREETDLNKITILEQRRKKAFGQEYDAFVASLVKQLNEEMWNEISLVHDSSVTTSDFFKVFDQFF